MEEEGEAKEGETRSVKKSVQNDVEEKELRGLGAPRARTLERFSLFDCVIFQTARALCVLLTCYHIHRAFITLNKNLNRIFFSCSLISLSGVEIMVGLSEHSPRRRDTEIRALLLEESHTDRHRNIFHIFAALLPHERALWLPL